MSAPFPDHDDPLRGAMSELVSAQSSLNMYADPIPGATGYVSETDANVKHAMEHLRAVLELLNRVWRVREADRMKFHRVQLKLAERKPNEACATYAGFAVALLGLGQAGFDESHDAEQVRDSMDTLWHLMSGADQAHARALVARLVEQFETAGHDPGDEDR